MAVVSMRSVPLMVRVASPTRLVLDSGTRVSALIDATFRPPDVMTFTSRPVPSRRTGAAPGSDGDASIFHFSPGDSGRSGGAVAAAGRNSGKPTGPRTAGGRPSTASTPASWAPRSKRTLNVRSGDPARRSNTATRTSSGAADRTVSVDWSVTSSTARSGALVAQAGHRHRLHLDLVAVGRARRRPEADVNGLVAIAGGQGAGGQRGHEQQNQRAHVDRSVQRHFSWR